MTFRIPIEEREIPRLGVTSQPSAQFQASTPFDTSIPRNLGNELQKRQLAAEKAQRDAAKKAEDFSYAQYNVGLDSIVNKSLAKVVNTPGQNAFTVADEEGKKVQEQIGRLRQQFPVQYHQRFSIADQKSINKFESTALGHQYRQKNIVEEQVYKSWAENTTNDAALSVYNLDEFIAKRADLAEIVELDTRRRLGGDPRVGAEASKEVQDAINQRVGLARSMATFKAIEVLTTDGDVTTAQAYANLFKDDLTAEDRRKVAGLLKTGAQENQTKQAKALSDQALELYPGNVLKQVEYVRANTDDSAVFNRSSGILTANNSLRESERKRQAQDKKAKAFELARQQDISGALDVADPRDHQAVIDYFNRGAVPRDMETFNNLDQMLNKDPDIFAEENIESYADRLPRSDIERFKARQKEVQGPVTGQRTQRSVRHITERIIAREGLSKKEAENLRVIEGEIFDNFAFAAPERMSNAEFEKKFESEMILGGGIRKERSYLNPMRYLDGPVYHQDLSKKRNAVRNAGYHRASDLAQRIDPQFADAIRRQRARDGLTTTDQDILDSAKRIREIGVNPRR